MPAAAVPLPPHNYGSHSTPMYWPGWGGTRAGPSTSRPPRLLAQRGRDLLSALTRNASSAAPSLDRRPPGRHQPLPCRAQRRPQTFTWTATPAASSPAEPCECVSALAEVRPTPCYRSIAHQRRPTTSACRYRRFRLRRLAAAQALGGTSTGVTIIDRTTTTCSSRCSTSRDGSPLARRHRPTGAQES